MVTLIIPPKKQIADVQRQLIQELSKASQIRDRQNRQSVQDAITSAKEKLKLYNKTPTNGLALFCGEAMTEDGKNFKKICYAIEPFKPINTSLYHCDNYF